MSTRQPQAIHVIKNFFQVVPDVSGRISLKIRRRVALGKKYRAHNRFLQTFGSLFALHLSLRATHLLSQDGYSLFLPLCDVIFHGPDEGRRRRVPTFLLLLYALCCCLSLTLRPRRSSGAASPNLQSSRLAPEGSFFLLFLYLMPAARLNFPRVVGAV